MKQESLKQRDRPVAAREVEEQRICECWGLTQTFATVPSLGGAVGKAAMGLW